MKTLRLPVALVITSALVLLVLRILPESFLKSIPFLSGIISYTIIALIAYVCVYLLGLPTLEYFGRPKFNLKTLFAVIAVVPLLSQPFFSGNLESKKISVAIMGSIFIFMIGCGEELFSRAFTFGILRRFGKKRAMFFSSLLFGLMHLNLYIGANWDPWLAYWHVMSAFGFGLIACSLMLTTRNIWIPIFFHAIRDVGVAFEKPAKPSTGGDSTIHFFSGLVSPLSTLLFDLILVYILLWIARDHSLPRWMYRLMIKWKLVIAQPVLGS